MQDTTIPTRTIGNTGIAVTAIGLGCWPMGCGYWGKMDDEDAIRTIHAALDAGINFLDTAPAYGRGHSEEVVGRGLEGRRQDVILSTKVAATPRASASR